MKQQTSHRQGQYTPGETGWHRPLIGIPTITGKRAGAVYPLLGAYRPFCTLVELAGGTPLLLPPVADPAATAAYWLVLDGLLLPGGHDMHPAAYGEAPHPLLGTVDPETDHLELGLVREALSWKVAILAVNRGMQVLNVALGGTLFQDLAAQLGGGVWHHATPTSQPRTYLAHPVSIVPGTHLAELVGTDLLMVNSYHHQGIKRLGEGLRIGALAPDDVIEAIEAPDQRFVLGVQFALESLALAGDQRQLTLFQAFIEAASISGGERRRSQMQARRVMERLEHMWERSVAAYEQQRAALFAEADQLPALEEVQLRKLLPILKGQVQAVAEALGRPDPTRPGTRL